MNSVNDSISFDAFQKKLVGKTIASVEDNPSAACALSAFDCTGFVITTTEGDRIEVGYPFDEGWTTLNEKTIKTL